jgi:hypothetical protein
MTATNRILGQTASAGGVDTTLYTVPVSTQASITVNLCNRSSSSDSYRIAIVPSAASISDEHYVAYDCTILGNSLAQLTGLVLNTGDMVIVRSGTNNVSFSVTGIEIA